MKYLSKSTFLICVLFIALITLFYRSKSPVIFYFSLSLIIIVPIVLELTKYTYQHWKYNKIFSLYLLQILILIIWCQMVLINLSDYEQNHIKYSIVMISYLSASIILANFITSIEPSQQARFFFAVFVVCLVAWGTLYFLFLIGVHVPNRDDFAGFFDDRNTYSVTVILLLTLLRFGYWSFYTKRRRIVLICGGIVLLSSVVISRSLTGTILSAYFIFFALFNRISLKTVTLGAIIFFFSVVTIIYMDLRIVYRASRFIAFISGNVEILAKTESAFVRPYMILQGIRILGENPVFGVGMDNARYYFRWPARDTGSYLHNNYLDLATSLGIFGFFVYYFPMVTYLIRGISKLKNDFMVAGVHLLVMKLLYDLTYTNYSDFFPVFTMVLASFFIGISIKEKGMTC